MSPRPAHAVVLALACVAAIAGLAGCSSDADHGSATTGAAATVASTGSTSTPSTDARTSAVETAAASSTEPATSEPDTEPPATESATTAPATTAAPTTTTVPDALSQLSGVAAVEVTAGGTDPTRPTFTWAPPAGATSYQLVVQSAAGAPLWAWTGAETSVVLGGVERASDVEGPTLTGPARVRVYAFDAAFTLVGASGWVVLPGA